MMLATSSLNILKGLILKIPCRDLFVSNPFNNKLVLFMLINIQKALFRVHFQLTCNCSQLKNVIKLL